ncbi:MAG: ComF family protein [Magnetococcales bacterium]|nr:ComF family protein [Magnetococcales bacterium]
MFESDNQQQHRFSVLSRVAHGFVDLLFPTICAGCRERVGEVDRLCDGCLDALPPQPENICLRCGEVTAEVRDGCGRCLNDPWRSDAVYCPFAYEGLIKDLIIGFKFGDHSEWAPLLAGLAWQRLSKALQWEEADAVMPIPLHWPRLIHRRFNQSALLARELARYLDRPLVTSGLKRIKMTLPQTQLDLAGRIRNVKGAFRADRRQVEGRSLLLVDDVMTTGATTAEAVAALKKAGANRVAVVCLSRAGFKKDTPN